MINANAMPTQKKVLGVGGEFDKPHLQSENAVEPMVAWLRTDFSLFICSPINANAMPTLYQRNTNQCQRYANEKRGRIGKSLCSDPDLPRWIPDMIGTPTSRGCKCWAAIYGMITSG